MKYLNVVSGSKILLTSCSKKCLEVQRKQDFQQSLKKKSPTHSKWNKISPAQFKKTKNKKHNKTYESRRTKTKSLNEHPSAHYVWRLKGLKIQNSKRQTKHTQLLSVMNVHPVSWLNQTYLLLIVLDVHPVNWFMRVEIFPTTISACGAKYQLKNYSLAGNCLLMFNHC